MNLTEKRYLLGLIKDCHREEEAHLELRLIREQQAKHFEAVKDSHPEAYSLFMQARMGPHETLLAIRRNRLVVLTELFEQPLNDDPQTEPVLQSE